MQSISQHKFERKHKKIHYIHDQTIYSWVQKKFSLPELKLFNKHMFLPSGTVAKVTYGSNKCGVENVLHSHFQEAA